MNIFKELFNPGNYYFNPFSIPNFVVGIFSIIFGVFIWLKNRQLAGIGLLIIEICVAGWLLGYSAMFSAKNISIGFFWDRFSYFFVCFISLAGYLLALGITNGMSKKERIIIFPLFLLMATFGILVLFTDLVIKLPLRKYFWGYHTRTGQLHPLFMVIFCSIALRSFYFLIKSLKEEKIPLERNRVRIFLFTYSLAYMGVIDFFADYGIGIYPFGYIFVCSYITLIGYNLIKYKVLGVETVFHKTIMWLAAIFLIVFPIGLLEFIFLYIFIFLLHPIVNILFLNLVLISFFYYYLRLRPQIDRFFGKKEYAYYELLGRISEKITATLNLEDISLKLLNELYNCILPQKIFIWLLDEERKEFLLVAKKIANAPTQFYKENEESVFNEDDLIIGHLKGTKNVFEPPLINFDFKLRHLKESRFFSFLQDETIETLVPLIMQDNLIGILALGRKQSLRIYTKKDAEILNTLGKELGTSIYNAIHHQDILEKQRLDEELRLVREIQVSLLPQESPLISGLKVSGIMLPAKEIGGDYYDYIMPQVTDRIDIVIGDASGKGLSAGVMMVMVKSTIYTLSHEELSPKQIILRINQILYQYIRSQKFMTLLYLRWQPQNKTLTYSSAGHEHILIYRNQTQELEIIQSGGIMIGILPDIENFLGEKQITLEQGDKVLLYTDGVTEAENAQGERFGLYRLKESFKTNNSKAPQELIQAIKDEVYSFMAIQPQYDDITLVGMEIG